MGGRGCERYEPSVRLRARRVSEHDPRGVASECGQGDVWEWAGAGRLVKEECDCWVWRTVGETGRLRESERV